MNNKAIILMYHGISKVKYDPWSLFVSKNNFREHLEVIRKYFLPFSLSEFSKIGDYYNTNKNCVILTFDDGYANNYYNAKPILETYNIPATFFITSGYLDEKDEFWWDLLERIFLETRKLPDVLVINSHGIKKKWSIFNSNKKSLYNFLKLDKNDEQEFITYRTGTLKSVRNEIKELMPDEREPIIKKLVEWSGIIPCCRETHRVLTSHELKKLAKSELFEIGCHTLTHPVLSKIDMESQKNEILKSKIQLEYMIENNIIGFSYPYGKEKHYNNDTLSILKQHGFKYACTSKEESISSSTDIFQLPRLFVKNWNGEEFQKNIYSYFTN